MFMMPFEFAFLYLWGDKMRIYGLCTVFYVLLHVFYIDVKVDVVFKKVAEGRPVGVEKKRC